MLLQADSDVLELGQRLLKPAYLPLPGRPCGIGRGLPIEQLVLEVTGLASAKTD